MIPRHRIPKIKPVCQSCGCKKVFTVMSQPFAEGYHRRHICWNCGLGFYTMALYNRDGVENTYTQQPKPFKDRALTEQERMERIEWAKETKTVTFTGNLFATEFIETLNEIFAKKGRSEQLTAKEHLFYAYINKIEEDWDNYETDA